MNRPQGTVPVFAPAKTGLSPWDMRSNQTMLLRISGRFRLRAAALLAGFAVAGILTAAEERGRGAFSRDVAPPIRPNAARTPPVPFAEPASVLPTTLVRLDPETGHARGEASLSLPRQGDPWLGPLVARGDRLWVFASTDPATRDIVELRPSPEKRRKRTESLSRSAGANARTMRSRRPRSRAERAPSPSAAPAKVA